MPDGTFCVMCGKSHTLGIACDPIWLEWVRTRRREIAAGVPWREATPMPHNREPEPVTKPSAWTFVIKNGHLGLKIDDRWEDEKLLSFSRTPEGAAEIERQWAEYDRRGQPLMSYQPATSDFPTGQTQNGN